MFSIIPIVCVYTKPQLLKLWYVNIHAAINVISLMSLHYKVTEVHHTATSSMK